MKKKKRRTLLSLILDSDREHSSSYNSRMSSATARSAGYKEDNVASKWLERK